MPTGLLTVTGTIDLDQFWPKGTSDADTTKIKVQVDDGAFRFRPAPGENFRVTHAFKDAEVVGKSGKKPAIDNQSRVTVRLQGIDAPELHYRPQAAKKRNQRTQQQHDLYLEWNLEFRQYYAETAVVALAAFLRSSGVNPLPCEMITAVDEPGDVFDTYGRLVGDIIVPIGNPPTNINQWLTGQGHVVPAFYNSMTVEEIVALTEHTLPSLEDEANMWEHHTDRITAFEWELVFRGKGAALAPAEDVGPVILPKLFRRQATYHVNKRARMVTGSFVKYLEPRKTTCT